MRRILDKTQFLEVLDREDKASTLVVTLEYIVDHRS